MHPTGSVAKPRRFLFEINVNPAEKGGGSLAIVRFVQRDGQIKGDHHDTMAKFTQGSDQRVVAKTTTAIHPARTWRYLDDPHSGKSFSVNSCILKGRGGNWQLAREA